jgi:hypothetical protein
VCDGLVEVGDTTAGRGQLEQMIEACIELRVDLLRAGHRRSFPLQAVSDDRSLDLPGDGEGG